MVNSPYIFSLLSPILAKSPKEVNKISKYFKRNPFFSQKKSYTQVLSRYTNIARETLKIKKAFSSFQNKKIEQVQKIISDEGKPKPQINMTTKDPSHKQIIIPMNEKNTINFVKDSGAHISNINRNLKNIKLDIMANFICIENKEVVIVTNKIVSTLNLQTIKKYIKSSQFIEADHVESPRLPQSKSYLKIIGIPYLLEQTNIQVTSEDIEKILKNMHIFNNIILALKPRIIKVFPKSDMAII